MAKHKDIPGQMPLWEPESNWTRPKEFPRLERGVMYGFDVETCDPHLKTKGPGFIRCDAFVVGFSLSDGKKSWYFPFAHDYGDQFDKQECIRFLKDLFEDPSRTFVGANTMYEREALWSLGIDVKAEIFDVQIAQPLIDENSPCSLEELGSRWLGETKNEELLVEAARMFGVDPKGGLWRMNPVYVGPYAEWDAWAPVHIWQKQMVEIQKQGLQEVLNLELEVQPILMEMRLMGIPVDVDAAKKLAAEYYDLEAQTILNITKEYGRGLPALDIWSSKNIATWCSINGIHAPVTSKGNPSFTKEYLESAQHPFLKQIRDAREYNRLASTFIEGWIINNAIDGRVHPQWKQLASDDGGTRTGRMAASNPNPQQVPKRSAKSKKIRAMFRVEQGLWAKLDYSQQEPRILMHFAHILGLPMAAESVQRYVDDPSTDFYNLMMELAKVQRSQAKDLYLGRCYGMGIPKLALKLRCSESEAAAILDQFDREVPFVKQLSDYAENRASVRGFIKTLSGRRRHFNEWEPASPYAARERGLDTFPVATEAEAREKWQGLAIRRADTRKALNSLIQGSAADMTKYAMVKVKRELGLVPFMQVHDELNYPCESREQAEAIQRCMENCVDLKVPIKADLDLGTNWM